MRLDIKDKPREFDAGTAKIKDCGKLHLGKNEMISLVTKSGREYDITAKGWGFYVSPSINVRLKKEGFRVALVLNGEGRLFINAVERDKVRPFKKYLASQKSRILCWLGEGKIEEDRL